MDNTRHRGVGPNGDGPLDRGNAAEKGEKRALLFRCGLTCRSIFTDTSEERMGLTQQKFSASSVEEDEQVRRAVEALGLAKQASPERAPGERVEEDLNNTIERSAKEAARRNGGVSSAEAASRMARFNAKQREARRQRELCLQWYDFHASLQETHERIAAEHEQKARAYLTEGTTT